MTPMTTMDDAARPWLTRPPLPMMTRGDHYRLAREALASQHYPEAHAWAAAGQLLPEFGQAETAAIMTAFLNAVDIDSVRAEVLEQIDVDPIEATVQVLTSLAKGVALA